MIEHGKQSSAAFGTTPQAIYRMLVDGCGLRVSLLASWLHGGPALTEGEFVASRDWYFLAHPQRHPGDR